MDGKSNPPQLEALSYPWNIPVIAIYSLTAFVSLSSNLITVIILLKGEHLSTELWKFLLNLSVADILMSIFCIPFTYTSYMLGRWIFPHITCALISCIQATSVTVSIYSLLVIGLDRYFAILYPFHPVPWLRGNKLCLIGAIWFIGIAISSPLYFNMDVSPFEHNGTTYYECIETWTDVSAKMYTVFLFTATFLIPIIALTFVYSRICFHLLRNSTAPGNPDQARDRVIIDRRIKVIKMLVTIVVMFFICWAPTHVFQLMVNFNLFGIQNQPQITGYYTYVGSYFFIHWLSQAHCLVNPFVYCFMSDNFRQSIRCTLAKCFVHFRQYEGNNETEYGRDLTQVQSVTMMATTVQMHSTTTSGSNSNSNTACTTLPRATDSVRLVGDSSLNGKNASGLPLGHAFAVVNGQKKHQKNIHYGAEIEKTDSLAIDDDFV